LPPREISRSDMITLATLATIHFISMNLTGRYSLLGACRVMGDRSEEVGERGQMFPVLRRIVDLCNEKTGIFGPTSQLRSRFIHNPTGSHDSSGSGKPWPANFSTYVGKIILYSPYRTRWPKKSERNPRGYGSVSGVGIQTGTNGGGIHNSARASARCPNNLNQ